MTRPPTSPLVSVVIPCYNQGHFLDEAIDSVLAQSHRPIEIIVVDDGSSDDTSDVARRYASVRLLRQANAGVSISRNRGLAATHGEHVVFLDADDRLLPGALEIGVRTLAAHPECAFVYGHHYRITMDGAPLRTNVATCTEEDQYAGLLRFNCIANPAVVMFRRSIFRVVGAFDHTLRAAEDYDLYLRVARRFPIRCHHHDVAEYRVHEFQTTRKPGLMLRTTMAVFRRQLRYLGGRADWRQAWAQGRDFAGTFYGRAMVEAAKKDIAAGRWLRVPFSLAVLAVSYPPVPARTLRNKLALLAGAASRVGSGA